MAFSVAIALLLGGGTKCVFSRQKFALQVEKVPTARVEKIFALVTSSLNDNC